MNAQELAALLDGRPYRQETNADERNAARAAGLVIVFGGSDDLVEFRGSIDDELGAYGGTTIYLTTAGLLKNECDSDDCPYHKRAERTAATIEAKWGSQAGAYSWIYETDIPHTTFDILDEGDKYCRGIVFALADVGMKHKHPTIALSPVKSSQIHAIGHDPATSIMYIQFKGAAGPGSTYAYENVSLEQFAAFKGAESIGHHFGAHFKKNEKHPYKKLGT